MFLVIVARRTLKVVEVHFLKYYSKLKYHSKSITDIVVHYISPFAIHEICKKFVLKMPSNAKICSR
jgi:hypothetical protein